MTSPGPVPLTLDACQAAIDVLNDHVKSHGGRVDIVGLVGRQLTVRFDGLCSSCPAWPLTLHALIRPYLRDELGLEDVEVEGRRLSDAARRRLDTALKGAGH